MRMDEFIKKTRFPNSRLPNNGNDLPPSVAGLF